MAKITHFNCGGNDMFKSTPQHVLNVGNDMSNLHPNTYLSH